MGSDSSFLDLFYGTGTIDSLYDWKSKTTSLITTFINVNVTSQTCSISGAITVDFLWARIARTHLESITVLGSVAIALYPDGHAAWFNVAGPGCVFTTTNGLGMVAFGLVIFAILFVGLLVVLIPLLLMIRHQRRQRSTGPAYTSLAEPAI